MAIARVLLAQPDILLLDEPTNNLDAQSVAWLERTLAAFKGTVVAVTHDRFFLDNVAGAKERLHHPVTLGPRKCTQPVPKGRELSTPGLVTQCHNSQLLLLDT